MDSSDPCESPRRQKVRTIPVIVKKSKFPHIKTLKEYKLRAIPSVMDWEGAKGKALSDIARELNQSLATPEATHTVIKVPDCAVGVKVLDFETFYKIRTGDIRLVTSNGKHAYRQEGEWFYQTEPVIDIAMTRETRADIDPRTGWIINGIHSIDKTVHEYRVSSRAMMPWGGGNAIGRLHTLREEDMSRFGNSSDIIESYFIIGKDDVVHELGGKTPVHDVLQVGDHSIAIALSGDNFFTWQLLRPDPSANNELRGVRCRMADGREKAFTFGSYHLGQNTSPMNIGLRRA
jgi:hypothetical protein